MNTCNINISNVNAGCSNINNTGKKDPLIVEKIIYAKPKKVAMTGDQVNEVLHMEVQYHLRNNPGLVFSKVEGPRTNSDRSHTYTLLFQRTVQNNNNDKS